MGIRSGIRKVLINWLGRKKPPSLMPMCDFGRIQHEVLPCDVLLIEGRSRVSRMIHTVTKSSWSHSVLYISRIHTIEDPELRELIRQHCDYDESTQLIIEALLGKGTIVRPLTKYRRDHIRICRPVGLTHEDSQKVMEHAIRSLGKPYHVKHTIDLARFFLPWSILPRKWGNMLFSDDKTDTGKVICSAMIAEAFKSVNFPILPVLEINDDQGALLHHRDVRFFTPSDFDYSPFFKIIKYPMINIASHAAYKDLPWASDPIELDAPETSDATPPTKPTQEKSTQEEGKNDA